MIERLNLKNFRGFASLELANLKRVNLVVGENNAGKTSLLEALVLGCNPEAIHQLSNLFRPAQGGYAHNYFRWLIRNLAEGERGQILCYGPFGSNVFTLESKAAGKKKEPSQVHNPNQISKKRVHFDDGIRISSEGHLSQLRFKTISVHHRQPDQLVPLFGKIQRRSGGEETLQRLLCAVDPRIVKIRIDPGEGNSSNTNQLILDVGLSELIPITQAGQGVYRLVSMLSDIIGESPDVLLIDEIENGLHHSVQQQVWSGLAEAAEKLGVQIFATTHSDECLRAAHAAFEGRPSYDFSVIQLFRVQSGVQGRVLDRKHIEASVAGNIDLR